MGIRKSQYHFRWDWGPELLCMGPDRAVHLRMWKSRLKEVRTIAKVDEALRTVLRVKMDVEGGKGCSRRVVVCGEDEKVVKEWQTGEDVVEEDLSGKVELWWPVGQGRQTRYTVKVELLDDVSSHPW